ncbi:MAG: hypothetical protein PHS31_09190 [Victivallaceae bacterium]|nr:hypothetical protein [Victivallaceae bacterium]MDD4182039.1 hypothetical protein [Victivallaceae bacterium]
MSRRRHLGTVYESYPAKDFQSKIVVFIFKLVTMAVSCLIWAGIFYMSLAIVNFLRVNLLEKEEMSLRALFESDGGQWTFWGMSILICVYILLSKIGSRKKSDRSKEVRSKSIYEINQQ